MNFEDELAKGRFMISYCQKCDVNIWPPNEICSKCFSQAQWKRSSEEGHIVEFSKNNEKVFCLAEFDEGVRIIGSLPLERNPKIGQKIKLDKCSLKDGNYNFEMRLC
jgi:uncharacterized OB-fold protein